MIIVSFQTIAYRLGKASRETWVFRFLAIGIHCILIFVHLSGKQCIHGKKGSQQINGWLRKGEKQVVTYCVT